MTDHPVRDFIKAMFVQFPEAEFKATSPTGVEIATKGWRDTTATKEFIPATSIKLLQSKNNKSIV